ncbi:hypothetical protein HELRODRAFT_83259, partial [Helobdella robusta]|uniref:Reverse transcriptase domain-containing protein n=1 Tax=Helobdella robusta TaxID=6412 RepID=T1G528_HELRO
QVLSKYQWGGIKGRSTLDHLISLETYIRQTLKQVEQVITLFLGIEKAYDTAWKYGILKKYINPD